MAKDICFSMGEAKGGYFSLSRDIRIEKQGLATRLGKEGGAVVALLRISSPFSRVVLQEGFLSSISLLWEFNKTAHLIIWRVIEHLAG